MIFQKENTEDFDNSMPPQKLKNSQKTEKWSKRCVNAIIAAMDQGGVNGRSPRSSKLINYDLVNSKYNKQDFKTYLNPLNLPDELFDEKNEIPIQIFNIIRAKIDGLRGEEMVRGFDFYTLGVEGEVLSAKEEVRKSMVRAYLEETLLSELGEIESAPQEIEKQLKEFDNHYRDIREKWSNQILKYLTYKEELRLKFNDGWEHALVAGEEIFYVGLKRGEPSLRVVNPPNFDYAKTPDLKRIQDAEWAVEKRLMSRSEIVDEFGDILSERQLKRIDAYYLEEDSSASTWTEGYLQNNIPVGISNPQNVGLNGPLDGSYNSFSSKGLYDIYCCTWKSWRRWGFLSYVEEGEVLERLVEDDFDFNEYYKERGYNITWEWSLDVWQGYRVGEDMYFGMERCKNQVDGNLPYLGRIYNSLNSESTSIVELVKPHQYFHAILWHKLRKEVAKAKGKKLPVDMSMIPKGWSVDKWMSFLLEQDLIVYNGVTEGNENDPSKVPRQLQQMNAVDMSISSNIPSIMSLIDKVEYSVEKMLGMPDQRGGFIAASETATNVGRALVQSSYVTEPLFYIHNECKKDVLDYLIELAKIAYEDGKKGQFLMDDEIKTIMEIDPTIINDSTIKTFLTNDPKDRQILGELKQLAQAALQADKIEFSGLIKIFESTSLAAVKKEIIAGEQDKKNRDQANMESQQSTLIKQEQIATERQKLIEDREDERQRKVLENKIELSQISQLGLVDQNSNDIPDLYEVTKLQQKAKEQNAKLALEEKKVDQQKSLEDRKLKLKEQELKIKAKTASKSNKKN